MVRFSAERCPAYAKLCAQNGTQPGLLHDLFPSEKGQMTPFQNSERLDGFSSVNLG